MNDYFANHKGYQVGYKNKDKIYNDCFLSYKKELKKYLNRFPNAKILEIGCGMGKFAYLCKKIGVMDYIGIDIDDYFFDGTKKDFPSYNFIKIGFQEYLQHHKNEFDIIFVSHVFEHLDEKERIEMIECIYNGLKDNGIWINYMPNADAIFLVGYGRWCDITHKNIYNELSFSQIVKYSGCNFMIENFNKYIGASNVLKRIIHLMFCYFTKIYFLGMGFTYPEIYTWEFLSILTKKNKTCI